MSKKKPSSIVDLAERRDKKIQQKQVIQVIGTLWPNYERVLSLSHSPFGKENRKFVAEFETYKREASSLYEVIQNSSDIQEFAAHLKKNPLSPRAIMFLVLVAQKKFRSEQAARIASLKNKIPKDEIREDWQKNKASYKSKADYARINTKLINSKYGLDMKPRTIEREWLSKTS